jgi:uncharacterized membrane protein
MDEDEVTPDRRDEQQYRLGRILAISDGVFAFSLTLLVVGLVVPTAATSSELLSQLRLQLPALFSYLLSFVVVAVTWNAHHESYRFIRRADSRLIALNFACLLVVAFLPFPNALLGRNAGQPVATVVYAVVLTLMNVANAAIWWYAASGRRLVDRDLDEQIIRRRFFRVILGTAVFVVSMPFAVVLPYAAEVMWLAAIAVIFVIRVEPRSSQTPAVAKLDK